MLSFLDTTDHPLDISNEWREATGEPCSQATAYMRAGVITSVTVQDPQARRMCRNAVSIILSADVIKAIEEWPAARCS